MLNKWKGFALMFVINMAITGIAIAVAHPAMYLVWLIFIASVTIKFWIDEVKGLGPEFFRSEVERAVKLHANGLLTNTRRAY